jgi:hypothetical protein
MDDLGNRKSGREFTGTREVIPSVRTMHLACSVVISAGGGLRVVEAT